MAVAYSSNSDEVKGYPKKPWKPKMPSPDDHQDYRSYLESRLTAVEAKLRAVEEKFEDRFISQEKSASAALIAAKESTAQALTSSKEAVNKAELAVEKRLEGMNEFRKTLSDQASTLMPRSEAEQRLCSLVERLDQGLENNTAKINALSSRMDRNEGRGTGLSAGWGYLIGALGVISTIVALFFALSK